MLHRRPLAGFEPTTLLTGADVLTKALTEAFRLLLEQRHSGWLIVKFTVYFWLVLVQGCRLF